MSQNANTETKNTAIPVFQRELPLSCPRPGVAVWNLHPQVYLPIEKTKEERCPYCSAHYILVDEA